MPPRVSVDEIVFLLLLFFAGRSDGQAAMGAISGRTYKSSEKHRIRLALDVPPIKRDQTDDFFFIISFFGHGHVHRYVVVSTCIILKYIYMYSAHKYNGVYVYNIKCTVSTYSNKTGRIAFCFRCMFFTKYFFSH